MPKTNLCIAGQICKLGFFKNHFRIFCGALNFYFTQLDFISSFLIVQKKSYQNSLYMLKMSLNIFHFFLYHFLHNRQLFFFPFVLLQQIAIAIHHEISNMLSLTLLLSLLLVLISSASPFDSASGIYLFFKILKFV